MPIIGGTGRLKTWTGAYSFAVDGGSTADHAPFEAGWEACGVVTHVFTHFELRLSVFRAQTPKVAADDGWWEPVTNLDNQALPTVMKKAITQAIPLAFV